LKESTWVFSCTSKDLQSRRSWQENNCRKNIKAKKAFCRRFWVKEWDKERSNVPDPALAIKALALMAVRFF